MATAVARGLISGYDDGTFRPDAPITRQELAVMVARALDEADPGTVNFTDAEAIEDWAAVPVAQAAAMGIVTGFEDGTFRPQETATRAQAAVMLSRLVSLR